jgi:hypothetical protein
MVTGVQTCALPISAERAERQKRYTEWAAAHPEEAAKDEKERLKKEREEERKASLRTGRRRSYFRETAADMRRDSGSYHLGREAGKSVSIDPQVSGGGGRISRDK